MRRIHLSYATAFAILLIVTAVASPRNLAANNDQLGTINLLHEANWYGEGDVPLAAVFAGLAVTPYPAIG